MNQTPRKPPTRISNEEFFLICDGMRTHREVIVKECHSRQDVATWVKQKFGIDAADSTIANLLKTANIKMEAHKCRNNGYNGRVLATCLMRLYKKLGEEVPAELTALIERYHGVKPEAGEPTSGVSVRSVIDPKTIPVVTPNTRPNERR